LTIPKKPDLNGFIFKDKKKVSKFLLTLPVELREELNTEAKIAGCDNTSEYICRLLERRSEFGVNMDLYNKLTSFEFVIFAISIIIFLFVFMSLACAQ